MTTRKSNVKIENGKVVFSQVLEYYESIRTKENSEWIDKYFEVLSDISNFKDLIYDIHHIIPCFVFKDKIHKTRKETEFIANSINGNLIKLSLRNHRLAHYYMWKIFNNESSRRVIYIICGKNKNVEHYTENEFKEFNMIINDCRKTNRTKEKRKEYMKIYSKKRREENKDKIKIEKQEYYIKNKNRELERVRNYRKNNIEKIRAYDRERNKKNKEMKSQKAKLNYKNNREKKLSKQKEYQNQLCIDSIKKDKCTLQALQKRKRKNKDLYKDINPKDCIIQNLPSKTTDYEITIFNL